MLQNFENALNNHYISGHEKNGDEWKSVLEDRRQNLQESYTSLGVQGRSPIDYSSLGARTAYLFAYAPTRAAYALEFLRRHRAALERPLFPSGTIKVVSFGGGPASELVGLVHYLEDSELGEAVNSVQYTVYDKDSDWREAAEQVAATLRGKIEVRIVYEELDFSEKYKMSKLDLSDVDLIFFSYVMSELATLTVKYQIRDNFLVALSSLKLGSKILFIDNLHPLFIKYFESCKKIVGLKEVNDDGSQVNFNIDNLIGVFDIISKNHQFWTPRTNLKSVSKLIVRMKI